MFKNRQQCSVYFAAKMPAATGLAGTK